MKRECGGVRGTIQRAESEREGGANELEEGLAGGEGNLYIQLAELTFPLNWCISATIIRSAAGRGPHGVCLVEGIYCICFLYSGVAWDLLYMYLIAEIENTGYMCGNSTGVFMTIIAKLHQSI